MVLSVVNFAAVAAVTDYVLTPSPDGELSSISTVDIKFPEAKFLDLYGSTLYGVTLTNLDNPDEVYVPVNSRYPTSNHQSFSFKPKNDLSDNATVITTPGRYLLHFPESCFNLCGSWYTHIEYSEEINVIYTVSDNGGSGFTDFFDDDYVGIRPMPGRVLEFGEIELSFPVSEAFPVLGHPDFSLISLRRIGENPQEYVPVECSFDSERTAVLRFKTKGARYDIPEYFFEKGEYVLDIPAGVFRQNGTTTVNRHMELHYTVTGAPSAAFGRVVILPEEGFTDEISEITVEYPDLENGFDFPEGLTDVTNYLNGRITISNLASGADAEPAYILYSATKLTDRKVALRFKTRVQSSDVPRPAVINAKGDYRLVIPPNTFKDAGDIYSFNARSVVDYNISREAPGNTMESYVLTPADGSSVGSLREIQLTFPYPENGLNWPVEQSRIRLVNRDNPDEVYKGVGIVMFRNQVTWGFGLPSATTDDFVLLDKPATYDLVIPAGLFSDYQHPEMKNAEIRATITVDPALQFSYEVTPDASVPLRELEVISFEAGEGCSSLDIDSGILVSPQLKSGQRIIPLDMERVSATRIDFRLREKPGVGNWTLSFPAGSFVETNASAATVVNDQEISLTYRIIEPEEWTWSVYPADGSRLTGISIISVNVLGNSLRSIRLNPDKGEPVLTNGPESTVPELSVSENMLCLSLPEGTLLSPGKWILTIPAGFVTGIDSYGYENDLCEIRVEYEITGYELPDLSEGIFFLNEGRYGSDYGSVNFLAPGYEDMTYRLVSTANHGTSPGITSQYATIFGDRLYIISKQRSYADPAAGGIMTVAGADDMKITATVELPADGRAVCGVDAGKAYITTDSGIFVYDADAGKILDCIKGTENSSGKYSDQFGEPLRLGHHVYVPWQGHGIAIVDTETNELSEVLELAGVASLFVTSDGSLYAATLDSEAPFYAIDTEDWSLRAVDTDAAPLSDGFWLSWRNASLATSVSGNCIYYVADGNSRSVSRYDFDRNIYDADFVSVPRDMELYGSCVTVDPATGYLVITAVGSGGGMNYSCNRIYFADAETGEIDDSLTFAPEDYFWFPAMMFYPVVSSPVMSGLDDISLDLTPEGKSWELDLNSKTSLSTGNQRLITYSAESADSNIVAASVNDKGVLRLDAVGAGNTQVEIIADYRGKLARTAFSVSVSQTGGTASIAADTGAGDVYRPDGTLVLRNADSEAMRTLEPGLYICNGRKIIINSSSN